MDEPKVSDPMPYGHLEELLKENLALAKENNRLLKRLHRNALIGLIVRVVLWLLVLGVPLYFLSSYLSPIVATLEGHEASTTVPARFLGLPSAEELKQIIQNYRPAQK